MDWSAGELGGDPGHQLAGQLDRAGGALARPQPEQHRQAHRGGTEGEADRDPGDHPPVAPADLPFALGGPVMGPERMMDLAAPPPEQCVVGHHDDRRARVQQPACDQPCHQQPQPVCVPDRLREEPARGVERDRPGHLRPRQHAHHAAPAGLRDHPRGQHREQRKRDSAAKRRTQRL
jgi:hypothetical protein